jgi:hypothetical protein
MWFLIGAFLASTTGAMVFFTLWMVTRRRLWVALSNLAGERQRNKQLREQKRGTGSAEVVNRQDAIDEIRQRYSDWNQDDEQRFF